MASISLSVMPCMSLKLFWLVRKSWVSSAICSGVILIFVFEVVSIVLGF